MTDKVAVQHDAERTRTGLEAWLADRGFTNPSVTLLPGPQATGYSHETIVFDVATGTDRTKLVARVEPEDVSVFPNPSLEIEYKLLDAIAGENVPLPALHGFEPSPEYLGAAFYVMEHLDGVVAPDSPPYPMGGWLLDAAPEVRTKTWWSGLAAMTTPHLVDWRRKGLDFINSDRPVGFAGELKYWRDYIDFVGRPVADSAERAWTYLQDEAPSDGAITLCWGDSRLGNQMFNDGHCVALLDWEMACLSDPIQDLAWFVHFDDLFTEGLGVARLDGIPPRDETIARYEDLTGHEAKNFEYHEIFASFRFTLILQRLSILQQRAGVTWLEPTDNFASQNLQRLLDQKGIA